jgi:hypothetical protein
MCLLDTMLIFYVVGGACLGLTGVKLYKEYKKKKVSVSLVD